jgi:small-conductance mechanosensitive channel
MSTEFIGVGLAAANTWWHARGGAAIELVAAGFIGLVAFWVVSYVARRVVARVPWGIGTVLYDKLRAPARVGFPLLLVVMARGRQKVSEPDAPAWPALDHALQLAVIGLVTWLVVAAVEAAIRFVKSRHRIDVPDNREARRIHTQATVIGRTVGVIVIIIGLAVALMTFPRVQQLGTSLLASAGIAGLALGLAARPVLENLIAGVQIGLTQPVRLDDVVIVDGEWGRVEEITLTYVVVRIWDERRLILPFSKFITESFQNWTRTSSQILGTVFVWLDYTAPIGRIREMARAIVEGSPLWDRRVFVVQVTETTERTMQVRVLVSAADAGRAFDLRCEVREKLVGQLQREIPECLPRVRLEGEKKDAGEGVENLAGGKS